MLFQPPSSGNKTGMRRRSNGTIPRILFAVATSVRGPSNIICNAWMTASSPTTIHQLTARRKTEKPAKSLWSAKDDNNKHTNEKNSYTPFQASWKTTTADDVSVSELPLHKSEAVPKKMTMPQNFPKFEAPTMNLSDFPKFEAPKMSIDLPKFPEMQMPKIPKMDKPSMPSMPELPKFQEWAQENTTPPGDTNTKSNDGDAKTNYSRVQASWKTTPTTATITTVAAPAANGKKSFPKLELPQIPNMGKPNLPSMPEFTMPKLESPQLPSFPDWGQGKATPPGDTNTKSKHGDMTTIYSRPKLPKLPRDKRTKSNNGDAKKDYSRLQASWKTPSPPAATMANGNNSFPKLDLSTIALPDDEVRQLSLQIDKSIKDKVNAFTGKTNYQVGDITKAIIAKVANEEFELAEVTFFFRILLAVGADLSGFSAVLPVSGLVGVFGWSISMGLAERFTQFVSVEINKRVNNDDADICDAAPTADASGTSSSSSPQLPSGVIGKASSAQQYNPGDLTKSALLDYTGKSSYAVGDLAGKGGSSNGNNVDVNLSVLQELEECLSMEKALIEKLDRIQQQQE